MCSGPVSMSSAGGAGGVSLLLELAASDDIVSFTRAVEVDGHAIDAAALWYGRSIAAPRHMCFDLRTPLMIAAAYGSVAVLNYILTSKSADVNLRCGSDGATALHCAAAGGAASSSTVACLLVDAFADVYARDASGNRPADVIARHVDGFPSIIKSLEATLKASCSRVPSPSQTNSSSSSSSSSPDGSPTKLGSEKKEYPPDLTLPDIKNGIYGTDEFRMYCFKIKPCSRAYSHDWTECPFVHPGENARRRDPMKYLYSCVPCPEFRKGSCRNGDACEYAHGVFECWLHPAQYRTRLCKDETGCNRRVCFFAHKPEELRSVNPSAVSTAGLGLSSPRSPSIASDMAALLMMQQGSGSTSPMSPKASSGIGASPGWTPPASLQSSRLKSTLSARDLDVNLNLLSLEGYQKKLLNDLAAASPRSTNWAANTLAAGNTSDPLGSSLDASMLAQLHAYAASRASDYSDLLGSLDPSLLLKLQGTSLKTKTGVPVSTGQYQSLSGFQLQQSMGQQGISGYGSNINPSSPVAATSIAHDQALAKVIMNSRASMFSKRSQSFCDRSAVPHNTGLPISVSPPNNTCSDFSDWGSPSGKLDWGVQGEELNTLRKASSFNHRGNSSGLAPMTTSLGTMDEPDLSWVQSLVKDVPGPLNPTPQKEQRQTFAEQEMLPPWAEQLYMEQEQMVA